LNYLIRSNFQSHPYHLASLNFDLIQEDMVIYILACIPLLISPLLLSFMQDPGPNRNRPYDTDRLALALRQHMGRRCIDAGYRFQLSGVLSYDNVTLIYIRNHGTNITWFHMTPGWTKIDEALIARISSLRMDVPAQFRITPHQRKTG
jgi:hypothetical protein